MTREAANPRKQWWIEVAAVILMVVVPNTIGAVISTPAMGSTVTPIQYAGAMLASSLRVIVPLLYIIWRSEDGWASFGIVKWNWGFDLGVGLLVGIVLFATSGLVAGFLAGIFGSNAGNQQRYFHALITASGWPLALMALAMTANSVAEELSMRSLLVTRFAQLSNSRLIAVLLSSVLFASYHIYEGVAAMLTVLLWAIAFGSLFASQRRVAPLIVAHTFINIAMMASYSIVNRGH